VVRLHLGAIVHQWHFDIEHVLAVYPDGTVHLRYHITPNGYFPLKLPRTALDIWLQRSFDAVQWLGISSEESYADSRNSQKLGLYILKADALHRSYEYLQENGSRAGARWLRL
jgi:hypothetical protein